MSKNIIFYFTGTGNCLKVANDIGNVLDNCEIISMPAFDSKNLLNDYDRIGFIFPAYAEGLPNAVKRFIAENKLPQNENTYYFTAVTHGGLKGNSISILNKKLLEKGICLSAGFDVRMVANYICLYNRVKNTEKIHEKSQIKIDMVKEAVKNKVSNKIRKSNPLIFWTEKAAKAFLTMDKDYNISEKCSGCGICYKVCPVKNIDMLDNRPIFKHNCEQCMACIQFCPKRAVNYKNKTQNRRRYVNPNITLDEIIKGNNRV
jgi:ferredoxin/flavodoxin